MVLWYIIILWDHRRIRGQSLTETLHGAHACGSESLRN